jgi:predicted acyl esterase
MPNKILDLHTVDDKSFPYVFEQNATVQLRSSDGLVRVNVYRPKTSEKVPVLVTYGPYDDTDDASSIRAFPS